MEMKFGKKKVEKILEKYYKEYEDFEGKARITCSLETVGCLMKEYEDVVVSVRMTGKLMMLGTKVDMTREIKEKEVSNIFTTVLECE